MEHIGYQARHVLAVGDNHNDISMLQYAGFGVAMLNSDHTVKNNAQYICKTDNNHDGLTQLLLEKFKG